MPQATPQQRNLMLAWFGCSDDTGPTTFLLSRGWTMSSPGFWQPPVPSHNASVYEMACLYFLRYEWDYDFEVSSQWKELMP